MKNISSEIKVIAGSLFVLYTTSFFIYFYKFRAIDETSNAFFILILFGMLVLACLGVFLMREWGRMFLIAANIVLGLYIIKPHLVMENIVPISYLAMCVIVLLFFSQKRVKDQFSFRTFKNWQTVLIIDDDEMQIKIVRPILMSNGYAVLSATTGEQGLRIASNQKPDLILLDVIMPSLKGRDVCRKLKENSATQDIPVVFFTAKDSPDDIEAEMQAGGVAHLTKPVDAKDLIETIQKILNPQKR